MAETDELGLDEAEEETKEGSGHKKIIIIVIIVGVILLGVAVGVTLVFTGAFEGSGTEEIAADWDGEGAEEVEVVEEGEGEVGERAEVLAVFYLDLEPEFVVNLEDTRYASFLSAKIQLMARDDEILEMVEAHMPVVRNHILSILASQPYEKLTSRKGKQQLRGEILKGIQKIVAQGGDRPPEVGEEGEGEEGEGGGEGEEGEGESEEGEGGGEENEDEYGGNEYGEGEEDGSEEGESEGEESGGEKGGEGEGEGVPEVSNNVAAVYFTSFIMQ